MTIGEDSLDWTPYADLHLINALGGLRAVGITHNFCMIIVAERFNSAMHMRISIEALRQRLSTFYDFQAADKLVSEIPFPTSSTIFELPEDFNARIEARKAQFAAMTAKPAARKVSQTSGGKTKEIPPTNTPTPKGKEKKKKGINRHFGLVVVSELFNNSYHHGVPLSQIRRRLRTFSDYEAEMDAPTRVPFPTEPVNFELPQEEFGSRIEAKLLAHEKELKERYEKRLQGKNSEQQNVDEDMGSPKAENQNKKQPRESDNNVSRLSKKIKATN